MPKPSLLSVRRISGWLVVLFLLTLVGCRRALYEVAQNGDLPVVAELIENGGDVDERDKRGCTALHHAAFLGHLDIVQLLLEHGASLDISDRYLGTPLHFAVAGGHTQIVETLLLVGMKVDTPGAKGQTPLSTAAKRGQTGMIQLLCTSGADPSLANEKMHNATPLHQAMFFGRTGAVAFLIDRGVDLDCRLMDGRTPLHLCGILPEDRGVTIARRLCVAGANPTLKDQDGLSPREYAKKNGLEKLASFLKEAEDRWSRAVGVQGVLGQKETLEKAEK